jgi:myo-inositol-1(or 4)-monophosphatase
LPASDQVASEHRSLVAPLEAAVREAGALALGWFKGPVKSWFKPGNSPVSEADLAVDALLRDRLQAVCPDCGWLSEETEDDPARLTARRVWIVDPIDGTRAFLAGLPDWTISIALAELGRPVLAAVYAPVADEMFLASAGAGATCNRRPIAVRSEAGLDGARIAGPRYFLEQLCAISPRIVSEPKVHSLALRLTRVAQGSLDAAFASTNSHDWDLAAADLLVHEAGGALTTFAGEVLTYNRPGLTHGALLAAGHSRHRELSELIRGRNIAHR